MCLNIDIVLERNMLLYIYVRNQYSISEISLHMKIYLTNYRENYTWHKTRNRHGDTTPIQIRIHNCARPNCDHCLKVRKHLSLASPMERSGFHQTQILHYLIRVKGQYQLWILLSLLSSIWIIRGMQVSIIFVAIFMSSKKLDFFVKLYYFSGLNILESLVIFCVFKLILSRLFMDVFKSQNEF